MGSIHFGGQTVSSEELRARIDKVAVGFERLGIGPGDGVGIYLRNDVAYFEASFGAGSVGAYAVPINWHYSESEAKYLLEDSQVRVLVIHADLLRKIEGVVPAGVKVLVVPTPTAVQETYGIPGAECSVPPAALNWDTWRDGQAVYDRKPAESPSTIFYTSGTTGKPKGVKRPRRTPEQVENYRATHHASYGFTDWLDRLDQIVTAVVGPLYHGAPNSHGHHSVRCGADVTIMPRFDPEELLRLIQERGITHLNMVPIMFNRLLNLPEEVKAKYDVSSLRYVVHAASPCPPAIKRAMIDWWGPIIHEYYGATETGNVAICTPQEWLDHPGTVGKPFSFADVRVLGSDGKSLPPKEVGEVAARIWGIGDFTYNGDPQKRTSVDRGGLITVGDVGYFDEDGFLYLCSRSSDMIISGGVNIYPAEIEAELHKMPGVADCAVFGIPDEEFGEAVCAVVQPEFDKNLDPENVRSYLRKQMAGFKVPKRIEFRNDLPREDSGKIFKRKLREPFWEGLDRRI